MEDWQHAFRFYCEDRNWKYLADPVEEAVGAMAIRVSEAELKRWRRMAEDWQERSIHRKHATSKVQVLDVRQSSPYISVDYDTLVSWQLEQRGWEYEQAWVERRTCVLKEDYGWWIMEDRVLDIEGKSRHPAYNEYRSSKRTGNDDFEGDHDSFSLESYFRGRYNRSKAVEYAEQWWNDYNPKFKEFDVDCTNYVSQCIWAGGAPMKYADQRDRGWWYRFSTPPQWSFSWTVAHSLRWYLPSSTSGLRGTEVQSASELQPGDVIVYDFDGSGNWEHNTFVVAKDAYDEPLVNAHTINSRMRYWAYRDSPAWTDNCQYKFFRIADDF